MRLKGPKSSTRLRPASRPAVSVVVPVEPEGGAEQCLRALQAHWPAAVKGELYLARGRQPSRQRNSAVALTQAEFIWFLDSDSEAQAGSLEMLLHEMADPQVAVAGGPNLPRVQEPWLGQVISQVLASRLGSGAARARYAPLGEPRDSGEKELILCNLLVRRTAYQAAGGLREDLYPNEENELLNRLAGLGWRCRYSPRACVRRPRRASVSAFAWQAFRYGRGRMQQLRVSFHTSDIVNLAPGAFVAYLAALPWALPGHAWAALPSLLYFAAAGGSAAIIALGLRDLRAAPLAWALLAFRHLCYGAGLWAGLLPSPSRPQGDIRVQRRPLAGKR